MNADLGSDSSEDDEDFNPEKEVNDVSEEEHSGDEEHVEEGGLKKKKRKKREQGWNMRLPVNDNAKEEEKIKEAFEKEKEDLKAEAEKQKTEDLWSDFKKDIDSSVKTATKKKSSSGGLGFLSSIAKDNKSKPKKLKTKAKPSSSTISSIFDTIGKQSTVTTVDKTLTSSNEPATPSLMDSIFETVKNKPVGQQKDSQKSEEEKPEDDNKIEITKVFDFAGDVVKDTMLVDKDSKEAQKYLKQQEEASSSLKRKPGGLNSIMGAISGKVTKMGTLDKSKRDWNEYVADTGIKEELQTHNRGKDGSVYSIYEEFNQLLYF